MALCCQRKTQLAIAKAAALRTKRAEAKEAACVCVFVCVLCVPELLRYVCSARLNCFLLCCWLVCLLASFLLLKVAAKHDAKILEADGRDHHAHDIVDASVLCILSV